MWWHDSHDVFQEHVITYPQQRFTELIIIENCGALQFLPSTTYSLNGLNAFDSHSTGSYSLVHTVGKHTKTVYKLNYWNFRLVRPNEYDPDFTTNNKSNIQPLGGATELSLFQK